MSEPDSFPVPVPRLLRLFLLLSPLPLPLSLPSPSLLPSPLPSLFSSPLLPLLPPFLSDIIEIRYDVWFGSSRRQDVMNVGAVIDKFFYYCFFITFLLPSSPLSPFLSPPFLSSFFSPTPPPFSLPLTNH